MSFIDKFPTYSGGRPEVKGRYINMEKKRIEDWTHTAIKSEEPIPLHITFEQLGDNPEANFERWIQSITSDSGGGDLR